MNTQNPTPKDNKSPLPAHSNGHAPAEAKVPPPSLPIDVTSLPDEVLAALHIAVPKEIADRHAKREAEFFALVEEQARALGIPPARLAAALRAKVGGGPGAVNTHDGRHFVKALLWNPKDHAQRWSKRGAAPKWYAEHLYLLARPHP